MSTSAGSLRSKLFASVEDGHTSRRTASLSNLRIGTAGQRERSGTITNKSNDKDAGRRPSSDSSDSETSATDVSSGVGTGVLTRDPTLTPRFPMTAEHQRLQDDVKGIKKWKTWGPYVSERQWATVREDYSADGNAWTFFPHDHARSRAYRWGEDGLAGISDDTGKLCWSLGLWNGVDPILKERLFGVTGHEGNHGEDVKELYYYLDSTPTHSYMKYLYKYPQQHFPYKGLVEENQNRNRDVSEFELLDTGLFDDNRYWDVFVEYAKDEEDPEAISIRISAYNRGPEPADLHIVPQLWFRNEWSWDLPAPARPSVSQTSEGIITSEHDTLGRRHLHCLASPSPNSDAEDVVPELLFTENDTNVSRLWGGKNPGPYVKDAFHNHIIKEHRPRVESKSSNKTSEEASQTTPESFVNPDKTGTKSAAHYVFNNVPANGGCAVVRMKLTRASSPSEDPAVEDDEAFDATIEARRVEADRFYATLEKDMSSHDLRTITRQALSGMLWSKQYYEFDQNKWIKGDPAQPPPPPNRKDIRNQSWRHLHVADVLSMPDKWEYPFFAVWDLAFHCIPLALVDPAFAKAQLMLFTRDWYMKADGEMPAYEWNFSDVNPPVHAWATFRVFKIERQILGGTGDIDFLKIMFHKLMINFTWWVNRKDTAGHNIFEGGFLGLDNIGAFNRSEGVPEGATLRQADATAWMAFYCLNMLNISLEISKHDDTFEDMASKFLEHFIAISDAMTGDGADTSLWNDDEGFYFDAIQWSGSDTPQQVPVRSLVGLIPLFATLTLEPVVLDRFPHFRNRLERFINRRPEVSQRQLKTDGEHGDSDRILLSMAGKDRLVRILQKMLDETEFLSDYGIRSLSKHHHENPFSMTVNGEEFGVGYWPGDSHSGMFGGNSNWRGPIWLATNFLLIESLQRFHQYYGDGFEVECPTVSGQYMHLANVAKEIQRRIIGIFTRDHQGNRATNGGDVKMNHDPHFRDLVLFHEYFHGDSGKGIGASHQTGWTGLVAYQIIQSADACPTPRTPKSFASHYFQEVYADEESSDDEDHEFEDSIALRSAYSSHSTYSISSALGNISPDAL